MLASLSRSRQRLQALASCKCLFSEPSSAADSSTIASMLTQSRQGFSSDTSTPSSTSESTVRRVPILESLFPGRGVSHREIVPKNYEPPGGPVTERVYMELAIGDRPVSIVMTPCHASNCHACMRDSTEHMHACTMYNSNPYLLHPRSKTPFHQHYPSRIQAGRVVFGLYGRYLPRTVANFRALITGENDDAQTYRGTLVHRVIRDLFLQGGDVLFNNGTGSWSIYGKAFPDESRDFLFSRAGLLAMANFHGQPHSNGSQWFVTLTPLEYLDRRAVVFGEVR